MTGKVTDEDSEPMFGAAWAEASAWFVLTEVFDVPSVSPGNHILLANRMTREQGRSVGLLHVQVGAREMDDVVLRGWRRRPK